MKNKIVYSILAVLCSIAFASCYEDKTTFATDLIDGVTIETSEAIGETLFVGYLEELTIPVTVKRAGEESPEGLTYEWAINLIPSKTEYKVIGEQQNLQAIINNPISTKAYNLKLTVTDQANGDLQYVKWWPLYIQSTFVDGLLVSDTQDGTTSDLTLITNDKLSVNYKKAERIQRNILKTATGSAYPTLITNMFYEAYSSYHGSSSKNYVWSTDQDNKLVRFDTFDYAATQAKEIVTYYTEQTQFLSFFKASQFFYALSTDGIYCGNSNSFNVFGWPNAFMAEYEIDNAVTVTNSDNSRGETALLFYDKTRGGIVVITSMFNGPLLEKVDKAAAFDPEAIPNRSAITGGLSVDGKHPALLLKDNNTGDYEIYTFNPYVPAVQRWDDVLGDYVDITPEKLAAPRAKYIIPNQGKSLLDKAVATFFCFGESILYVATESGIYAINFSLSTPSVSEAKFTPEAGEKITLAKLYQQGVYMTNPGWCAPDNNGVIECPLLPLTNKAILIATQNGEKGTAWMVPMTQLGTGNLDKAGAMKYPGFGKILEIITTGY